MIGTHMTLYTAHLKCFFFSHSNHFQIARVKSYYVSNMVARALRGLITCTCSWGVVKV